jgi:coenzyme F420 hydrogenase subunit beta
MHKPSKIENLAGIVQNGLCMGCGLCQAIAGKEMVSFVVTPDGRQRPMQIGPIDTATWNEIEQSCPGIKVGAPIDAGTEGVIDPVWGPLRHIALGHAADRDIRFRAAGGGVLTALASYLISSGEVDFVMQVRAAQDKPMRTETVFSRSMGDVIAASSSRYGPATPLDAIRSALDTGERFAFVGKPCDISGLRNYAIKDSRVHKQCVAMLALVCGGGPEFWKSRDLVRDLGYSERDVTLMRYRGFGNPGRARIEVQDGAAFELTYAELWDEESKWASQTRCRLCPDGIGEGADIVSGDFWPNCQPSREDAGFNSIMVRSERGERIFKAAVASGALVISRSLTVADMSHTQPHQVKKKQEMWARYSGLAAVGHPYPEAAPELRLRELAQGQSLQQNLSSARGARARAQRGRFTELPVTPDHDDP